MRQVFVNWPNEEERKAIGSRIFRECDIPNCVGIADGTLFPLGTEPQTEDAPDYHGRKFQCSLSTMIICDDHRLIRCYNAGWPGSAHDNRIFRSGKLALKPKDYFSPLEYLIGDSAFENDWFMVSAFKKPANVAIPKEHEACNEKLARLRIISEHTIGVLKGRFPWLKSIRLKITEDIESMKRILVCIDATVMLHNMLMMVGEEEADEWLDDDMSAFDDAERVPIDEDIFRGVPAGAVKDKRRQDLLNYFLNFDPKFIGF